jgi:hypothetical protein
MSGEPSGESKLYSRRDFLRILGIGGASLAVTSLLTACDKLSSEEMKLTFKEIEAGDSLPLNISGESPRRVVFQYANSDIDKIQVRQEDGLDKTRPFENGGKTVRMLGEISDPTLYKVTGKNPALGEEITVGVYPKVTGYLLSMEGRRDLSFGENTYALPVIVANVSYLDDQAPAETNKSGSYNREDWRDVQRFGNGLAVGTLNKGTFTVEGYVSDARAVTLK